MKTKAFSIIAAIFLTSTASAQYYNFSTQTSSYANLSSPTVISAAGWDGYTEIPLHLPFTFQFFGASRDSLYLLGGGFAAFQDDVNGSYDYDNLYYFEASLKERSVGGPSDISTGTSGSPPNRIFKLQVQNAGLTFDFSATEDDYTNVQLWLYETSNIIEIHFGPSSVAPASYGALPGPMIGLFADLITFINISGNASSPTASTSTITLGVNGTPSPGMVYRFVPGATAINDAGYKTHNLFPNPCNGSFCLSAANAETASVEIFNAIGAIVFSMQNIAFKSDEIKKIDSGIPPGLYFVKVQSDNREQVMKLVVE